MLQGSSKAESAVALLLSALLFWAPIPFGSVTPTGELWLRLAAFGGLALAVAAGAWPGLLRRALPVAALAAIALLGLAQSVRWPAPLAATLSPEHARLYRQAAAVVEPGVPGGAAPLTLDVAITRSSALSWLAAAALLTAALIAGRRARHRRWLLAALAAAALVQLVIALAVQARSSPAGLAALLRPGGRLRGSFANPNHLSLLFEITMAPVAAWGWYELTRRRRAAVRRLSALVPIALWLVLLAGVVLTGSRAGLVAAAAGFAAQATLMPSAGRRRAWLPVVVFLLVVAALAALASRTEIRRYETASIFEDNLRSRVLAVPAALELWRRFPVTGTGLGTFQEAFPGVAPPELTAVNWNRAHNNPVELLVTGGLIGLGMAALAFAGLLVPALRLTRRAQRSEDRAAGLAAVGALGAAGLHELLDFGLVIPANHLALLAVLGAAAAVGSAGGRLRQQAEVGGAQRPAGEVGHLDEMQARGHLE